MLRWLAGNPDVVEPAQAGEEDVLRSLCDSGRVSRKLIGGRRWLYDITDLGRLALRVCTVTP